VAERKEVEVNGNPQTIAVAETTLTFTDQHSGDNYTVEASPYDQPLPAGEPDPKQTSGTLTAWKLIYYERDRMPNPAASEAVGGFGEDPVKGHYVTIIRASEFSPKCNVMLFDGLHHLEDDENLYYKVTWVETMRVYLNRAPQYTFSTGDDAELVNLDHAEPFLDTAIDTTLVPLAFGVLRAFVAWKAYPLDADHPNDPEEPGVCALLDPFDGTDPHWDIVRMFFDHEEKGNVAHFMDAYNAVRHPMGWTSRDHRDVLIFLQHATTDSTRRETLVHECGHVFEMKHATEGHPRHHNMFHPDPPPDGDGCVMIKTEPCRNDPTNNHAYFGGTKEEDNYEDLRDRVAGHADPVSKP
jgi:hypothetical protein